MRERERGGEREHTGLCFLYVHIVCNRHMHSRKVAHMSGHVYISASLCAFVHDAWTKAVRNVRYSICNFAGM